MKNKHFKLFCFVIACIITVPLLCTLINYGSRKILHRDILHESELYGVITVPEKPKFSLEALLSRQFQSETEQYFEYYLASRKILTRVYNQLLYSVFRSTDNSEMVVGRDDTIFEKAYPTAFFVELTAQEKVELKEKTEKLAKLTRLLKERGVTLVVRMSPSKAEHYPEFLPPAYDRFLTMQQSGEYAQNWYDAFIDNINQTDVPFYDGHDQMQELKEKGEIVFTKGGTHWSLAPMAGYVNGLNSFMEGLLNKKLGRIVETSREVIIGEMGAAEDCDIWNICWNAVSAKPNYPSPNITFRTIPGEDTLRVFTVGQSFTTGLLGTIYSMEQPVWEETYFSWYNGRVIRYSSESPTGVEISAATDDYEQYMKMDVILIEFIENGTGWTQFEFIDDMLKYLEEGGAEQ